MTNTVFVNEYGIECCILTDIRLKSFGISDFILLLSSEFINHWIYITLRNILLGLNLGQHTFHFTLFKKKTAAGYFTTFSVRCPKERRNFSYIKAMIEYERKTNLDGQQVH